jgi:hypothetical protein
MVVLDEGHACALECTPESAGRQGVVAALSALTSFFSKCPTCGYARLQSGYTRDALVLLLETGDPIDAYCVTCDVHWPIAVQERYLVARGIAAMDERDTPPSPSDDHPPRRPPSR